LKQIYKVPTQNDYLQTFQQDLASWAFQENVKHTSLLKLLIIVKNHSCFLDIPSDPRSLLKTPKQIIVKEVQPGIYWHYGLKIRIIQFLKKNETFYKKNNIPIEIVFNVDGLPISRSSGGQVWPILGSIYNFTEVFIIGIYYGQTKKPDDSNLFLEDFIADAKELVENGVIFNNNLYRCVLKMLCADAPAKAFVLNVKSHSGYSSCTKCIEKGEYQNRRIAFSDKPSQLRTDEDFINKTSEGYHLGTSGLENIPQFGLVSHVPLDYQHLLCLGVVKKLINLWLCDALKVRLPFRKVQVISNALENIIRPHVPVEFQRKPRSLFTSVNGKLLNGDNYFCIVDQPF